MKGFDERTQTRKRQISLHPPGHRKARKVRTFRSFLELRLVDLRVQPEAANINAFIGVSEQLRRASWGLASPL